MDITQSKNSEIKNTETELCMQIEALKNKISQLEEKKKELITNNEINKNKLEAYRDLLSMLHKSAPNNCYQNLIQEQANEISMCKKYNKMNKYFFAFQKGINYLGVFFGVISLILGCTAIWFVMK